MNTKYKNALTSVLIISIILLYFLIFYNRIIPVTSNAGADSTLQVKLAMNLSDGKWLGPYNDVTLSKGLSFPFLLAVFHSLHLPFSIGLVLISLLSTLILMGIVIPFFNHKRLASVVVLIMFLFNPIFFVTSVTQPYRDTVSFSSMVLLIGWSIGSILNFTIHFNKQSYCFTLISGLIGLCFWENLREDSSWIYLYLIISFVIIFIFNFIKKKNLLKLSLLIVLPLLVLCVENTIIATLNYRYYNRFVVNEYKSKDFKEVIGTMSAIKGKNWVINVPVNTDVRKQLYRYVPISREFEPYLDGNAKDNVQGMKNIGVQEPSLGRDYQGGWFPWAYRGAVVRTGKIHNSKDFKDYNIKLVQQINDAVRSGKIKGPKTPRASLVAPFNMRIIDPIIKEVLPSFKSFLMVDDFYTSIIPQKEINKKLQKNMAKYLRVKYPSENKTYDNYNRNIIQIYKYIYIIIQFMLIIICIGYCVHNIFWQVKEHIKWNINDWLILSIVGIGLSIILRIIMLTYVSVTSFPAIFTQYLSSSYSLLSVILVVFGILVDRN